MKRAKRYLWKGIFLERRFAREFAHWAGLQQMLRMRRLERKTRGVSMQ